MLVVPRSMPPPQLLSGSVCENSVNHIAYRIDENDATFPLSHAAYAYKVGGGYRSTADTWEHLCITIGPQGDYDSGNIEIMIWR